MQPEQSPIDRWSGAAPFWEKHREPIRQMFAPVAQALIEEAGIGAGYSVLDVATGPGEPALTVASLVGPEGKVWGIDPAPEMIAAARREAERQGLQNAEFEVAFADRLPFPANTFDAAVSRFGAMFFPVPAEGIGEILRVLKPGRTLALAVWAAEDENPFFHVLERVIERYVKTPPPEPGASDAFRFAGPGKLRSELAGAGATAPRERLLQFQIEAPLSGEDFWTLRTEMSERLRDKIATLPREQAAAVKRESLDALAAYATQRGMSLPAQVWIVSGTKP